MPSGFKAPGNEGVVLKLMMDDANSDDAFAPKVYAALEAEHGLTKRFMGAADDTIGTAAGAPNTTHIAAMFGGTTWQPPGALLPPTATPAVSATPPAPPHAPPAPAPPPATPGTATNPSVAAVQRSVMNVPSTARGYPTGKAIAKNATSHLAADWVCVYDDLFSADNAWPDSKACYDYFKPL